ncbi:VOC family protein [Saccharomonospora sp. NPDC046836]|uniref:VOC family protein n=1 Tax=Saccharomonospora sp. NPDC046836 TaxID=3156921 RepID=UPI003401A54F
MAGDGFDLDHVALATNDAAGTLGHLRRELGARVFAGERITECRYATSYIGEDHGGSCLEVIEPADDEAIGFVSRFLDTRGEGPHHITFMVPDLRASIDHARKLGYTVVKESHDYPPWREAFLMPDRRHGIVVQFGQSSLASPAARHRGEIAPAVEAAQLPHVRDGRDRDWWAGIMAVKPRRRVTIDSFVLYSTDLAASRRLFVEVLRGDEVASAQDDRLQIRWPGGRLEIRATNGHPGLREIVVQGLDSPISIAGCGFTVAAGPNSHACPPTAALRTDEETSTC